MATGSCAVGRRAVGIVNRFEPRPQKARMKFKKQHDGVNANWTVCKGMSKQMFIFLHFTLKITNVLRQFELHK